MSTITPLKYGEIYHIYNRGNNLENIFIEERNYHYFMHLNAKYIPRVANTLAYCLLGNHFHFLVRIREEQDCQSSKDWQSCSTPSQAFSNLFSTYTKAINKAYQRTGSLFEKPFKRRIVDNDSYFTNLVLYIHRNPEIHGFIDDFRDWPFSSFNTIISNEQTNILRAEILSWFGNKEGYISFHMKEPDMQLIGDLIGDDEI
jgi:REP element-mobilizing transposase RayT